MRILSAIFFSLSVAAINISAQDVQAIGLKTDKSKSSEQLTAFESSEELNLILTSAVTETIKKLAEDKIKPEEIAATVIDLSDPKRHRMAYFNGEKMIYPASVVKMFYLAAIHRWLEDGKIKLTAELERGLRDMIVDSSNDATHYILDVLTDTSSGGEMPEKEFIEWSFKRNSVNRYFSSLGYQNINVNQKTYCEDAYGREQQFRNFKGENRNMLTTNATARLLAEIALRRAVSAERSGKMLELMKRDPFAPTKDNEDQAHGFTGISLNELNLKEAKLFSKAGWTSRTRHDAAYIETPGGLKLVIVIFTENHANQRKIIPLIASAVITNLPGRS